MYDYISNSGRLDHKILGSKKEIIEELRLLADSFEKYPTTNPPDLYRLAVTTESFRFDSEVKD